MKLLWRKKASKWSWNIDLSSTVIKSYLQIILKHSTKENHTEDLWGHVYYSY